MKTLRIAGTISESIVDGPGIRYVVFTQGCPHHCEGCHNPQTHDFNGGEEIDPEVLFQEFRSNPLMSGMTFSGGEPFCQPAPLTELARAGHAMGKTVMAYSGYTFEQLRDSEDPDQRALLEQCDILVDGPFVLSLRDTLLRFRGSSNQRLIDVPKSLAAGEAALWGE